MAMDRGICIGSDKFHENGRAVLSASPNMEQGRAVRTMRQFMEWLDAREGDPTAPGGAAASQNVVFIAHGHEAGIFYMDLGDDNHVHDSENPKSTSQLVLDAVLAPTDRPLTDPHRTLRQIMSAPPSMALPATKVWLKGCNVAKAPRLLGSFKALFGGQVTVIAPLHYYLPFVEPEFGGVFEFMAYDLHITKTGAAFDTPARVVGAFMAADFRFIDGTKIPEHMFNTWVTDNMENLGDREMAVLLRFGRNLKAWTNPSVNAPPDTAHNDKRMNLSRGRRHKKKGNVHHYRILPPVTMPTTGLPPERWPLIFNFHPTKPGADARWLGLDQADPTWYPKLYSQL